MSEKVEVLTYSTAIISAMFIVQLTASKTTAFMAIVLLSSLVFVLLKREEKHEAIKR